MSDTTSIAAGEPDAVMRRWSNAVSPTGAARIPLALKLAYTAFMAVLVPVYWTNYGPANFFYFCDMALILTLIGVWREDALLISMPAVGGSPGVSEITRAGRHTVAPADAASSISASCITG